MNVTENTPPNPVPAPAPPPLDPNNPSVRDFPVPKVNPDQLKAQQDIAAAMARQAAAAENMIPALSGDPTTEGGIYLTMLQAVLVGKLAESSTDAQVWAADLTRDYLAKYNLNGTPRTSV